MPSVDNRTGVPRLWHKSATLLSAHSAVKLDSMRQPISPILQLPAPPLIPDRDAQVFRREIDLTIPRFSAIAFLPTAANSIPEIGREWERGSTSERRAFFILLVTTDMSIRH
jgi:hypothetical protein